MDVKGEVKRMMCYAMFEVSTEQDCNGTLYNRYVGEKSYLCARYGDKD